MVAAVIAGVVAALTLEPAEHVLNLVSTAVEHGLVRECHVTVGFAWDESGYATSGQDHAEPSAG